MDIRGTTRFAARTRPLSGALSQAPDHGHGVCRVSIRSRFKPAFRKPARAGDCWLHSHRLTPAAGSLLRWTTRMAPSTHPCGITDNVPETGLFVNPAVLVGFWPDRHCGKTAMNQNTGTSVLVIFTPLGRMPCRRLSDHRCRPRHKGSWGRGYSRTP